MRSTAKNFFKALIRLFAVAAPMGLVFSAEAWAAQARVLVQQALAEHLGAQRVELLELRELTPRVGSSKPDQGLENDCVSASVLHSNSRGEAEVLLTQSNQAKVQVRVRYAAWALGWVATRRIQPNEQLQLDALKVQEINVASGLAHEYRGVLLSPSEDLSRLEARQTLLEGGFVTTVAVRKIPDLRRGDSVRLDVISGEIRLSTPATALEPANINQRVRVQTARTKRDLVGLVREAGIVEVRL